METKRKLGTIRKVLDLVPIEGADNIELAKIDGWQCVVKKGELTKGSFCIFLEIDSLLPKSNPVFDFLSKGTKEKTMIIDGVTYVGYRLKTIRLKKTLSQGLALSLSLFPLISFGESSESLYKEGTDVSATLGIVKYEAPIPAQLQGKIKGNFPSFLKKTDEERIQNCGDLLESHAGEEFYITEKLDGTSVTFYKKDGVFGVCSRNLDLLETEGNTYWEMAKKYNLAEVLNDGWAIQGEIVGDNIQDNPLKIHGHDLFVFNIYNISTGIFLDYEDFKSGCFKMGVKTVPIVATTFLKGSVDDLLLMADGPSLLNFGASREGMVFRPVREVRVPIRGAEARLSFKVISNKYLLGEK